MWLAGLLFVFWFLRVVVEHAGPALDEYFEMHFCFERVEVGRCFWGESATAGAVCWVGVVLFRGCFVEVVEQFRQLVEDRVELV